MSITEPMSSLPTIAVEAEPATDLTRTIFDGLYRSNVERTGDGTVERLCVVARGPDGALVGGLYGEIYWGWLHVLALWVAPPSRGQRLGTQLLSRAEDEAIAKGCRYAYLDTFSFQSVGLYTSAGYEIFGSLEHYPAEHSRYFLRKALRAAQPVAQH
jgi:ribosomal protein S18 acetylase RimI-like enzyme